MKHLTFKHLLIVFVLLNFECYAQTPLAESFNQALEEKASQEDSKNHAIVDTQKKTQNLNASIHEIPAPTIKTCTDEDILTNLVNNMKHDVYKSPADLDKIQTFINDCRKILTNIDQNNSGS